MSQDSRTRPLYHRHMLKQIELNGEQGEPKFRDPADCGFHGGGVNELYPAGREIQGGCWNGLEYNLACTEHLVIFYQREDPEVADRNPVRSSTPLVAGFLICANCLRVRWILVRLLSSSTIDRLIPRRHGPLSNKVSGLDSLHGRVKFVEN